jgi:hypothetical protein
MPPWARFLTFTAAAAMLTGSAGAAELAVVGTGDGVEMLEAVGSALMRSTPTRRSSCPRVSGPAVRSRPSAPTEISSAVSPAR